MLLVQGGGEGCWRRGKGRGVRGGVRRGVFGVGQNAG